MDVYACDVCFQKEDVVGHLRCGRYEGYDYQICYKCQQRYNLLSNKDIVTLLKAMKALEKPSDAYWKE